MVQIIKAEKKTPQVADILHHHIDDYKIEYPLWPQHRKIVSDLLNCRTAQLGGHIERCDSCGAVRITYHSCRNRHCPKCQHMPRERWLEKRKDEILPVCYFHVVFTLPHELNTVILNNKKVMLNCLFAAASKTLLTFGNNELNGILGFLANRNRRTNLKAIRKLLKLPSQLAKTQASLEEMMLQLTGIDITTCPCCNKGKMQLLAQIPSYRARAPNNLAGVAA